MIKDRGKIALVLGGGGARGLSHIGVLKRLEEEGVVPEVIVGTSIGALIGGTYAAGLSVGRMEEILRKMDILAVAKIFRPGIPLSGIVDGGRVAKLLRDLVGSKTIESLPVPFRAVATDLITGEDVVFDRGPLIDALMASIAIPVLFKPVFHQGRYLVDGGLSNPLPVSVAHHLSKAPSVAVNVSPDPAKIGELLQNRRDFKMKRLGKFIPAGIKLPSSTMPTLLDVFLQTVTVSTSHLIAQRLEQDRPRALLAPAIEEFGMLEFHKGPAIATRGYEEAERAMTRIAALFPA
jgi:NTE family protein